MPRDYAKSQLKHSKPIAGWIWMLAGLSIGLFVALLVYIKDNSSGQLIITETVAKVFQTKKDSPKTNTGAVPQTPTSTKPKFDFYTILPALEVAIPDIELLNESSNSSTQKTKQKYMLQAGSFKKYLEADKLKARLALQGIEASIQKVTINNNGIWHRVRIGPIDNIKSLNRTRQRLRNIGIASIVVKNKS